MFEKLRGRCLEDREQWAELEELYYRMLAIFNSAREMGLDSISFRKLKYRLAILNERQYGDPGLGVIRNLIAENSSYDKYHLAFRWMLWKHTEIIKAYMTEQEKQSIKESDGSQKIEESKLIAMALDKNFSESEFLERLKTARGEKNSEWNGYRHFINKLKLPMAF